MAKRKYFYTYVLIGDDNRLYIGKRSCNCLPKDDPYMGSATDATFKPVAKHILNLWPTWDEASLNEIKLHKQFNVASSLIFANRANATSLKFNTFGVSCSENTKLKIAESQRSRLACPKARKAISIANTGKTHTEETKTKISKSCKGRMVSEKTRALLSAAKVGKPHITEELRLKLIASQPPKKYIWYHSIYGEMAFSVRELSEKFNLTLQCLHAISNGTRAQHKGWTCLACVLPVN